MRGMADQCRTALLVLDMQNDFIEEGAALEVRGIRTGVPKLKRFIAACRAKGMSIVYTRHLFSPEENPIEAWLFPELKKTGLRVDDCGAEIVSALAPREGDIVIDKKRYDAFHGTKLGDLLRARGVSQVIITGTMTEVCCESTARGAMMRDFEVLFCSDLTFTRDARRHAATLDVIRTHFGLVKTSEEMMHQDG